MCEQFYPDVAFPVPNVYRRIRMGCNPGRERRADRPEVRCTRMEAAGFTRQVVVRLSARLHDLIVSDAEANGRTVAQTVRFRLEHAYGLRDSE
jgi:hypothetical protein